MLSQRRLWRALRGYDCNQMTATATPERVEQLWRSEGFAVESPAGLIGWVEEVWLDERSRPCALALCMVDGRRALLLTEQVVAVDEERQWIVVEYQPPLLELDAPRLTTSEGGGQLRASWVTTGERLVAPTRSGRLPLGVRLWLRRPRLGLTNGGEWPLWKTVVVLYATIALLLLLMITLAFSTAWIVTGTAY
jgi:hypothetical protein